MALVFSEEGYSANSTINDNGFSSFEERFYFFAKSLTITSLTPPGIKMNIFGPLLQPNPWFSRIFS